MYSSSKSNTPARKSGTQSMCLSGPKHACQQAFFRSFSGSGGGEGTVTWGTFPRGFEGTVVQRSFLYKGGGGG